MSLITEYPTWFILFCLLLGAGYALLLYFRNRLLPEVSLWQKGIMAFFRFAVVSALAFLLLGPLLKTTFREVEKPLIIFAQDNSQSVIIGKDSAYYQKEYPLKVRAFTESLEKTYDFQSFSFGEKVREELSFDYSGRQTDISGLLDELYNRYSNRNIGAVIIASDGLYNKGMNPVYASSGKLKAPVYTVALGDTAVKKDLLLARVAHNRLAYLGNSFPLEVQVDAHACQGESFRLTVLKEGKALFSKNLGISGNDFTEIIPITLEAKQTGIQRYTIKLTELDEEISYVNNTRDIYIDVLDSRQKVLLLSHAPHPDMAAIRLAAESNENYEVTAMTANEFKGNIAEYNLVILHQLPSLRYPIHQLLTVSLEKNIPLLFVIGSQTALHAFNNANSGLNISGSRGNMNESQAAAADHFSLFNLSENTLKAIRKFPPLKTHFGDYKKANSAHVLLRQKIGMVETDMPLLLFNAVGERKTGILAGEGIWRWKLQDYQGNSSHDLFNELISKTIQYLALKADKSPFRVSGKNSFLENEPIIMEAEVYNESYELMNEPEVKIKIMNEEGREYTFVFSKSSSAYRLNAGMLPAGHYRYEASTKQGDKLLMEKGEFSVNAIQVESINTVANHQLMYQIAQKTGGAMYYPAELDSLSQSLATSEEIKSISYTRKQLQDLIHLKWVFFLLLALLSAEWFLRKRSGAY